MGKILTYTINPNILRAGIRKTSRVPRNSMELVGALNCEARELGLREFVPVTSAISSAELALEGVTLSWPNPMIFRGKEKTLLVTATKVFEVDESTWLLSQYTTYNAHAKSTTKSITSDGVWQFLDAGDTWMLFNGTCTVFHTNLETLIGATDKVFVQDSVYIETGCYHRGIGLLGGFDSSNFWTGQLEHFIEELASRHSGRLNIDSDIADNMIWWSSVGGGDLMWLFYPDLVMGGLTQAGHGSDTYPMLIDYFIRNESGFAVMPFRSRVRHIKSLGQYVIVYGDDGVVALKHSPLGDVGHTFAVLPLMSNVGVKNRGAVGGDEKNHVFVDNRGIVWRLTGDLKLEMLDYREVFGSLSGTIIVAHEESENDFYLGNGTSSYLLTNHGLTQIDQVITSAFHNNGTVKGCWVSTAGASNNDFTLESGTLDFGGRGVKLIHQIALGSDIDNASTETLQVAVRYKYANSDNFSTSDYVRCNQEGVAFPQVAGTEFRILIKGTKYSEVTPPDYITVSVENMDRRFERGYAVTGRE